MDVIVSKENILDENKILIEISKKGNAVSIMACTNTGIKLWPIGCINADGLFLQSGIPSYIGFRTNKKGHIWLRNQAFKRVQREIGRKEEK